MAQPRNLAPHNSGDATAVIIVKAAPQRGERHGETVCTAAITTDKKWVRLYPIAFRTLDDAQKFKRWDIVTYKWRLPSDDKRPESRRLDHETLVVTGTYPKKSRFALVEPMIVDSLVAERAAGRSFAFIRPTIKSFHIEKKSPKEFAAEQANFDDYANQTNFFFKALKSYQACPYRFKYKYRIADGERTGTCQDWETEATFFLWSKQYGEEEALKRIQKRWGEEMPSKGLLFAMGTHSLHADTWLINGLVQMSEIGQLDFGF